MLTLTRYSHAAALSNRVLVKGRRVALRETLSKSDVDLWQKIKQQEKLAPNSMSVIMLILLS